MTGAEMLLAHRFDGDEDRPTVLLLNGIMMSLVSWDPVVEHLTSHYRVLRCDLRGQLLSPGQPPAEMAGHADDLLQLLDHLEIERLHVAGTSFGGIVGGYLAARAPQRVLSYTTIASTVAFDGGMRAEVERWHRSCVAVLEGGDRVNVFDTIETVVFSEEWRRCNREHRTQRRQVFAALDDTWYLGLRLLLESARAGSVGLGSELDRISCPTLVIAAGDDGFIPRHCCRALAEGIADARFAVIEGAGHAVVVEQPARLAELIARFLQATDG